MKIISKLAALGAAVGALAACATVGQAQEVTLDPTNAKDAQTLMRKMQCSTVDGRPAVYAWEGKAYARRQGEKDTHLFNVEGMNIRSCSGITDEKRGPGFALVSREILLYTDKDTGEVLDTWDNPWTGASVEVQHVENDPVNWESYETGWNGKPATWGGEVYGNQWYFKSTFPLWYSNPLAGDYQEEIGGTYHATEMFNFFGRTDDLFDPSTTEATVSVGWARLSDWLPWMKMNGREGAFYVHTAGFRVADWNDMSETMKTYINERAPLYRTAPPSGDTRDNMTSWKHYMEWRKAQSE